MYWYQLYGLRLQSNRPLPTLPIASASDTTDWTIHIVGAKPLLTGWQSKLWENSIIDLSNQIVFCIRTTEAGTSCLFHFDLEANAMDIIVEVEQKQLWICWQHQVPELSILPSVSDRLSQIVLSYLLRLQGSYVLHAAAVAVNTKSFLLIAKSGTGKSSLTLAFAAAGLSVLSEEIAILQSTGRDIWVQPSLAFMRLLPDSLAAISISLEGLTPVAPQGQKFYLPLSPASQQPMAPYKHSDTPTRLSCIYWLADRNPTLASPQIISLRQKDATTLLLNNRYHPFRVGQEIVAGEFRQALHLAATLPIRQVSIPDDLGQLRQTAAVILDDFHHVGTQ